MKGNTTVETSLAATVAPSRSTDAQLDAVKTEARARATLTMNYSLGDMSVGEAEERLLGGAGRGPYSRFMTLHRRRRRKLPTRCLAKEHQALLDDLYNGLTQVTRRPSSSSDAAFSSLSTFFFLHSHLF